MSRLKKIIFGALCNRVTGLLIGGLLKYNIPDMRWKKFRFSINPKYVRGSHVASIFWGFYESAEIQFVEKYLDGNHDVIELGGSIGIVSSHIASRLQHSHKLITVEANPFLIDSIEKNVGRHISQGGQFELRNLAIGYDAEEVTLVITDDNTETRIAKDENTQGIPVKITASSLKEIIDSEELKDFAMVCDIEGAEINVLMREQNSLLQCSQLIIELHESTYQEKKYTVEDMISILTDTHNFKLISQHGPVCYFSR